MFIADCEKCQQDLDGPCFEHTDIRMIVFDKVPVPLAYSSLPDILQLRSGQPRSTGTRLVFSTWRRRDYRPIQYRFLTYFAGNAVFAKESIEAWTLFGPLIAPLIPLDEATEKEFRYILRPEETGEYYVRSFLLIFKITVFLLKSTSSN